MLLRQCTTDVRRRHPARPIIQCKALIERIVNEVRPLLSVALLQSKDTKMQHNALAENGGGHLGSDASAMVIMVLEQ
jgi:hypothetical protein